MQDPCPLISLDVFLPLIHALHLSHSPPLHLARLQAAAVISGHLKHPSGYKPSWPTGLQGLRPLPGSWDGAPPPSHHWWLMEGLSATCLSPAPPAREKGL